MTYIPDLAPVSYMGLKGLIRAVGWLESPHPFRRGSVDPEFGQRLMTLVERPPGAFITMGLYWCTLCAAEGKLGPHCHSSQNILLVPAPSCVYENSDLDRPLHLYQPPDEF